jgi:hypothetical protein
MMYAMAGTANGRIGLLDHAFSEVMQGFAGGELHDESSLRLQTLPSPPGTLPLPHLRADDALVHI